jgi:uncharacterized UPF0160 family protein
MIIGTHDGAFHADEVVAVAEISLLHNEGVDIIRTRDPDLLEKTDMIVDVGCLYDPPRYIDHHQELDFCRENGIPYASAGLVGLNFKTEIFGSDEVYQIIDKKLLAPIDAGDNGYTDYEYSAYGISDAIKSFYPAVSQIRNIPRSDAIYEWDYAFRRAVNFAKDLLRNEIQHAKDWLQDQKTVEKLLGSIGDAKYLVLSSPLFWKSKVISSAPNVEFVVAPNEYGDSWLLHTVPSDYLFTPRRTLPRVWAGLNGKDLEEVTGIEGVTFCHKNLFIAGAKTKESAVALAQQALGEY